MWLSFLVSRTTSPVWSCHRKIIAKEFSPDDQDWSGKPGAGCALPSELPGLLKVWFQSCLPSGEQRAESRERLR